MQFLAEAARRSAMAATASEQHRSLICQNRDIALPIRGQVFTVLVDATYFNLELWETTATRAWSKLKACHTRLLRRLFVKEIPADDLMRLPEHVMCMRTGHPPLEVLLRSKRLRYLISLIKAAPRVRWALIKWQQSWAQSVKEDLRWFTGYCAGKWPAVEATAWPLWWHQVHEHPGQFRRDVRKATAAATVDFVFAGVTRAAEEAALRDTCREFPRLCRMQPAEVWVCAPCLKTFSRKAHLAVHFFKVHQRKARQRYFHGDSRCPGCGLQYHCVDRLYRCIWLTRESAGSTFMILDCYVNPRGREPAAKRGGT